MGPLVFLIVLSINYCIFLSGNTSNIEWERAQKGQSVLNMLQ